MNKILTKVTALCVGLAMVAGVGVAVGSKAVSEAKAAEGDAVTDVANIVTGNTYYIRATVGTTDYYWKAGGGESVGTGLSGTSTTTKSEAALVTFIGSGSSWAIQLSSGKYLTLSSSKANGKYNVVASAENWTVTNDTTNSLLNLSINGYCLMKNSSTSLNFGSYKSGQTNVWLEEGPAPKTLQSITLSKDATVKTAYYAGESAATNGLTVMANYDSGDPVDVTNAATITANPTTVTLETKTITYTATFNAKTSNSVEVSVSVEKANAIALLYNKSDGDSSGEFYGYYVGFATGSGPIVMDGKAGIMLYNSSEDVSSWVEGTTIIHITAGTISIYNGLYEVKSYTCEVVSTADIATPIVHTTTGSESAKEANRLTNATGKVAAAPTKGSFTGEPGASDIQFTYTVGSKTFTVFYKKAAQTSEVMSALNDSLENETEITIKGFTSWFNSFQVTMTGLVEEVETYTAEDFAQDLLDQTDLVCTGWEEGDNNHDAIEAIWSNLASADKYPSLPAAQKQILAEADRDESGTVVEQAMARYDFLTGKYELNNFINGRTPIVSAGSYVPSYENNLSSSSSITIIVIVAVASMTLLGVTLVIRKRKMN